MISYRSVNIVFTRACGPNSCVYINTNISELNKMVVWLQTKMLDEFLWLQTNVYLSLIHFLTIQLARKRHGIVVWCGAVKKQLLTSILLIYEI